MYPIPLQTCLNPQDISNPNPNPLVYTERVYEKPVTMESPLAPYVPRKTQKKRRKHLEKQNCVVDTKYEFKRRYMKIIVGCSILVFVTLLVYLLSITNN